MNEVFKRQQGNSSASSISLYNIDQSPTLFEKLAVIIWVAVCHHVITVEAFSTSCGTPMVPIILNDIVILGKNAIKLLNLYPDHTMTFV